jgi:iron(III) transport system substrate-binding protein
MVALAAVAMTARAAEEPVLNLYSSRHYQTDEALYENFTKATGIRINRIEAGDEQLLERIRSEGGLSPADVLLIVDAARLWSAQQQGLFQPVRSATLADRIPASMRDPDGNWYGFSSRARVIVYSKAAVDPAEFLRIAGRPEAKGRCTRLRRPIQPVPGRGADHRNGERRPRVDRAVVANVAPAAWRDTDQIRVAGGCAIALSILLLRPPAAIDEGRQQE